MKRTLFVKMFLGFLVSVLLVSTSSGLENQDDDNDDSCDAKLADTCFHDVYTNLDCHFNLKAGRNCEKKTVEDLCSAINDGLDCSSDMVDTDCIKYEGSEKFDVWLIGLRAVQKSLCSGNSELMRVLVQSSRCWSISSFLTCVEQKIGVNHVVDFLAIDLNLHVCLNALLAMANCNARATSSGKNCTSTVGVVSEMMHTFFSASGCGSKCTQLSSGSKGMAPTPTLISFASSVGSALLLLKLNGLTRIN